MDGHSDPSTTYDLLESWKNQLQLSYVQHAAKIAGFEQSSRVASGREHYRQLDLLARDIERAEYALKLFRLQHVNVNAARPPRSAVRGEAA